MLITRCAALVDVRSRLLHADAISLLKGCSDAVLPRDAYPETHHEALAPSFWLVSLRPGSHAAQIEAWADSPPGSSFFVGHQIVVQSQMQLGRMLSPSSPALSAELFPASLKLNVKDAATICRASSSRSSASDVHLVARASEPWAATLDEKLLLGLRMRIRTHSATSPSAPTHLCSLSVSVPSQHSALLAHWLISQPSVLFMQVRPVFTTLNNNAAWKLQSGVPSLHTMWQQGLRGEGQLVSVGDTGIHPNSCFFSPQFSRDTVQSTIRSGASGSCSIMPRLNFSASSPHPKLHAYLRYTSTDFSDIAGGHGTHVCGSASGSSSSRELAAFNGMAPSSKLVFIDLAQEANLIVPDDLGSDYFPCIHEAGARISSNSWGGVDNTYDLYASSTDSFVYAHDDLLVLVAAGNDGTRGEYTVGTPATAKNILAVGAVTNSIITDCQSCMLNPSSVFFSVESSNVSFVPATFSADICSLKPPSWPRPVPLYRPPLHEAGACEDFQVVTCNAMRDKAVVLSRGICVFTEKSRRAIACGASVVIIVNINSEQPIVMDGEAPAQRVPVFSVGRQFPAVAQSISGPYFSSSTFSSSVIAPFSSLGPTRDGRTKPDIVAPGSPIFSSNALDSPNSCTSSGTCTSSSSTQNVAPKSGTSMATPLVAGIAALIRQYLAEGFYPGGFRGSGISIDPSAALMRAIIIGGSRSVRPLMQKQRLMAPFAQDETPSFAQGWGSPVASFMLPFANATFPARSFSIKLFDRWPISAQSGSLSAQFWVQQDASPLTVTLAWTDPASLPVTDTRGLLVNDIDLLLVSPQGKMYAGNSLWSIQLAPNSIRVPLSDTVNNQEQVHVPRAELGMWGVHVRSSRLSTASQLVAVAIAGEGHFVPGSAPNRCSSWCKGTCASGDTCLCTGIQWGPACDGVVVDIPLRGIFGSYSEDVILAVGGWRYYRFVPSSVGSTLDIYMFSADGDPDLFVSSDDSRVPDLLINSMKDQRCDTCGEELPYENCDPCVDDVCRGTTQGCFTANRIESRQAVIVGFHASCCKTSVFKIKFVCQSSLAIVLIVIGLLFALIIVFLLWKWRERIYAFSRKIASSWRRSTTRPRLSNFINGASIRQVRATTLFVNCDAHSRQRSSSANIREVGVSLPTRPRQSRTGYSTLEDGISVGTSREHFGRRMTLLTTSSQTSKATDQICSNMHVRDTWTQKLTKCCADAAGRRRIMSLRGRKA
jgi:subtilisin family serine protease